MDPDITISPRCHAIRNAISATIDNESTVGLPDSDSVADHVRWCTACAAFASGSHRLQRSMNVQPVGSAQLAQPDHGMSPELMARIAVATNPYVGAAARSRTKARIALGLSGVIQLALSIPPLLFGHGESLHMAREMGSWYAALAIGLIVAAWQPRRAEGLLPMCGVLAVLMLNSGAFDALNGHSHLFTNVQHLLSMMGLAGLYWVSHPSAFTRSNQRVTLAS